MTDSCFSFKLPKLTGLSLRRGNSRTSLQQTTPENPYCVVVDFSAVTEKECGKLDAINERKYNKLIHKANKAERTIQRTGLSMNLEVPPPPHPSNRDRYIIWKKRNVFRKVIPQSEAIIFLTKNNYVLNKDYEAYQAIDLANELKKDKGIPLHENDKTHNFDNVYNHHDNNILRRRSMYRANKFRKPDEVQPPPSYGTTHDSETQQEAPIHIQPQPLPLPLPPIPGAAANLRSTQQQQLQQLQQQPQQQPQFQQQPQPNQFYPQLPPPPIAPPGQPGQYNQYLPPQNQHMNAYTNNIPSAPSAPSAPVSQSPQKSGNNIRFSVSCSANDGDSDTSF